MCDGYVFGVGAAVCASEDCVADVEGALAHLAARTYLKRKCPRPRLHRSFLPCITQLGLLIKLSCVYSPSSCFFFSFSFAHLYR